MLKRASNLQLRDMTSSMLLARKVLLRIVGPLKRNVTDARGLPIDDPD